MISAANITMQFGAKPLFENISVKFGQGRRYGLIGAYLDAAKESIETQNRGATHMLLIKPMRLPESTFEQLNLDLRRLVDKYAEASELMFRHRDDVPEYHITLVAGPAQRKL